MSYLCFQTLIFLVTPSQDYFLQYLLTRLFDEHVVISSSAFLPMNLPVTGRRPPSVWEAMLALSPASARDVAFLVSLIDDAIQSASRGVT